LDKNTQVGIVRELLRQLDHGTNTSTGEQMRVPANVYTCRTIAEREWQVLFRDHPQIVGFSRDLPERGSYFTVDDFGLPLLVTRDTTGRARAFLNACRHRGARVAQGPCGKAAGFACPYHGWTYSIDGSLQRITRPADFGPLDRESHGLVELPAAEVQGLVWVHPRRDGKLDVAQLLGPMDGELAGWDLGAMTCMGTSTIEMPLNWKLANDTFGESYHVSRLHRRTLGQLFHGDVSVGESIGKHHRLVLASKDIDELRKRPESEWRLLDAALLVYFLFPNVELTVSRIGANLVRIYPDATNPGRSVSRISYYLRPQVVEALGHADQPKVNAANAYDLAARRGTDLISHESAQEVFRSTIEQEDYAMGVATQRAAESGLLEYVQFGCNEPGLHHYHRCFRDALGLPPLERVPVPTAALAGKAVDRRSLVAGAGHTVERGAARPA